MSAIRRMGVIAEYGSLAAYRAYVIEGRHRTGRQLLPWEEMSDDELAAHRADIRAQIADWDADLAWVDAEIASDAVSA